MTSLDAASPPFASAPAPALEAGLFPDVADSFVAAERAEPTPVHDRVSARPMLLTLTLQGPARLMGAARSRTLSTGSLLIGRSPICDWVLPDPDRVVSGRHCRIDSEGNRFVLTDLSTNGVYPDDTGEPLGPGGRVELRDGQVLRLGDAVLLVELSAEHTAPRREAEAQPVVIADDWFAPAGARQSADGVSASLPASDFADLLAAELTSPSILSHVPIPSARVTEPSFSASFGDLPLARVLAALDEALGVWEPDQVARLRAQMENLLGHQRGAALGFEQGEADGA